MGKLLEKVKNEYNFSTEINGKLIKFRPWNTKEEKDYLLISGSKEKATIEDIENVLLANTVENWEILKETLTDSEKFFLILEIRKISISETIDIKFKCTKCGKLNDLTVEIDKLIHYKKPDFHPVTVGNKTFYFNYPKTQNLIKRVKEEQDPIEKNFKNFLIHIEKIEIDGEVFDTFTFDELYEFVSNLPSKEFDELFEEFDKMKEEFDVYLDTFCLFCNAENKIVFGGIEDFLWE